jgi:hypothetical protein
MTVRSIVLASVLIVSGSPAVSGHHSVPKEYDVNKVVVLAGVIASSQLVNPHVTLDLENQNQGSERGPWRIEMAAPNALTRRQIDLSDQLAAGRRVTIEGWPALDGSRRLNGRILVTSAGARLDIGDNFNPMNATLPVR